jgi:hypothetical protein
MQPYLFPYAGYYRLFASCDCFVILDCVQFARRGRVHRCEIAMPSGALEWLTLPLARQPQSVLIKNLAFSSDAPSELEYRLSRHSWLNAYRNPDADAIRETLKITTSVVVDYLEAQLRFTARLLGFGAQILRSSTFGIPADLRGQDRIVAIATAAGATTYVNSPGGHLLYDRDVFRRNSLDLDFLPPFSGDYSSVLPRLMAGEARELEAQIRSQLLSDNS